MNLPNKRNPYYKAPSDSVFEDMRRACIKVWKTYDHYGYQTEKIGRIKDIKNISDNFMYMFSMFDHFYQREIVTLVTEHTREEIKLRLLAGGNDEGYLILIGLE